MHTYRVCRCVKASWSCSRSSLSLSGWCSGWPGHVPQDGVRLRQPQRRSVLLPRVRPSSEQPVPTPERPADLRQRGHVGGELPAVPVSGECPPAPELHHCLTLERYIKKKQNPNTPAVVGTHNVTAISMATLMLCQKSQGVVFVKVKVG